MRDPCRCVDESSGDICVSHAEVAEGIRADRCRAPPRFHRRPTSSGPPSHAAGSPSSPRMPPQMSLSLFLSQLDQSAICGRLAGLGMSQGLGCMLQVRVQSTHDSRTAPKRLAPGCAESVSVASRRQLSLSPFSDHIVKWKLIAKRDEGMGKNRQTPIPCAARSASSARRRVSSARHPVPGRGGKRRGCPCGPDRPAWPGTASR